MISVDPENLDAAVDVGQVQTAAVRRKLQACIADLSFFIGLEDVSGNRIGGTCGKGLGRERDALENGSKGRGDDYNFMSLACGCQELSVGAQGESLRTHVGQIHLDPYRSEHLVNGRYHAPTAQSSDWFSRMGGDGVFLSAGLKNYEQEGKDAGL